MTRWNFGTFLFFCKTKSAGAVKPEIAKAVLYRCAKTKSARILFFANFSYSATANEFLTSAYCIVWKTNSRKTQKTGCAAREALAAGLGGVRIRPRALRRQRRPTRRRRRLVRKRLPGRFPPRRRGRRARRAGPFFFTFANPVRVFGVFGV